MKTAAMEAAAVAATAVETAAVEAPTVAAATVVLGLAGTRRHQNCRAGKDQQEGPQRLGQQAAQFEGGVVEAVHPPRLALGVRAELPPDRYGREGLLAAAVQLLQSSLPGTRASSSTRWAADTR